jgi:aerobic carbon-monoxide dehydrogenase medium subunit
MYSFNYVRPASVADAVKALGGADARVLAGGQTLLPTMKMRLAKASTVVDLAGITDLKGVHRNGNAIGIGAMTTHAEVARNADIKAALPALAKLAGNIGDAQVRHRGTIGGSLANNDPAADYPAAMLALGATIVTNKRNITADQFFTGLFSTALEPGEIITGIGIAVPEKSGYAKFEQRASRYALVGVFVAKTAAGVRVAVTGAGERGVFRSSELEAALSANFSAATAAGTKVTASGLMGDLHAQPDYRAALITAMAEQAVATA